MENERGMAGGTGEPSGIYVGKYGRERVILDYDEICYFSSEKRGLSVHAESFCVRESTTLSKKERELPKGRFLRINQAIIVNLHQIRRFKADEVELKTGESFEISVRRKRQVWDYLESYFNRARHI